MNVEFIERMESIANKLRELQEENNALKARLEAATPIQTTPVGEEEDQQEQQLEYKQHEQKVEEDDDDLPITLYSDDYSLFSCCCCRWRK